MLEPVLIDMPNGRVGSTLLMKVLGASNQVAFDRIYPYESRFICHSLKACDLPFQTTVASADELAADSFLALWSSYSDRLKAAFPQAQYYAEKLLTDMPLGVIHASGVTPRYIELVRDPRDILVSIRAFNAKRGVQGFGRNAWSSEAEYFAWYLSSMDEQLARLGHGGDHDQDRILVRYEDLAADLPAVASRLGQWLGVDLSEASEYVSSDTVTYATHSTTSSVQSSVGRWRTELSPLDAREITERLAPHLDRLGYDR
jgi:hypothetical protein